MRASIAILLLIGVAQCRAQPAAQESALIMVPLIPRVTDDPTDGAVTTDDAPAEVSPTPDEFLLKALLKWVREVSIEELRGWDISNHNGDAPVNAFGWTSKDYTKLANRIVSLYAHLKGTIEEKNKDKDEIVPAESHYLE
ncbi:Hypothetical predicted protein [Cloeon dipterum]|uniref:Uncharacterized protein n=1 Tax=Cloeon dipterum TaxID=197152 RepID=A0A8S1DZX0_9INSE|nr:Hypothetical predicted protein [Cloeon dipterum]